MQLRKLCANDGSTLLVLQTGVLVTIGVISPDFHFIREGSIYPPIYMHVLNNAPLIVFTTLVNPLFIRLQQRRSFAKG